MSWEQLLNGKTDSQIAELHIERWTLWWNFIHSLPGTKHAVLKQFDLPPGEEWRNYLIPFSRFVFDKITVRNGTRSIIEFDASFGSLNKESDLDVVVRSNNEKVFDKWIAFVETAQSGKFRRGTGVAFATFWDAESSQCSSPLLQL